MYDLLKFHLTNQIINTINIMQIHFFSPGIDIAIVELDRPATLNSFVNTICLPNGESPPVGEACYAAGFGVECQLVFCILNKEFLQRKDKFELLKNKQKLFLQLMMHLKDLRL